MRENCTPGSLPGSRATGCPTATAIVGPWERIQEMIIKKDTRSIECDIFKTEGHESKARSIKVFTIRVPAQTLVYNISNKEFEDRGLKIEVLQHDSNAPKIATGVWSIDIFSALVDGVKAVTDTFIPYIRSNLAFMAEAAITEDTHIWSRFKYEEVGGGMFKSGERKLFQVIKFQILGLQSEMIRWEPEMLDPLITLRDNFIQQRDQFIREIVAVDPAAKDALPAPIDFETEPRATDPFLDNYYG